MGSAVTVTLDEATMLALDALAASTDRTRDAVVIQAIADLAALNDWQIQRITEGVTAADRGDFASDAEIARVRAKFRDRE